MQFWRFLNHRLGISISQSYLITDSLVVLLAGFAFGWIRVLYGLVMIYVSGSAAETSSEGSDVFRTAWIVTNKSDEVSHAILDVLERGVTILSGKGAYTGAERPVLYCVVTRSEVNQPGKLIYLRGLQAAWWVSVWHPRSLSCSARPRAWMLARAKAPTMAAATTSASFSKAI